MESESGSRQLCTLEAAGQLPMRRVIGKWVASTRQFPRAAFIKACAIYETPVRWPSCQRRLPPSPAIVVPVAIQILCAGWMNA